MFPHSSDLFERHLETTKGTRVGLLQTAHSWADAGVLLGGRVRRRIAFETIINYRDEVRERKVIVN